MTIKRILFVIVLLLVFAVGAEAQASTPTQRTRITLINGDFLEIKMLHVTGDKLQYVGNDSTSYSIPVDSIAEVRFINKTELPEPGSMDRQKQVGSILMGTDDEIYDFTRLDFAEKIRKLYELITTH